MRYWICKDDNKGIIFITFSKFTRISGELKEKINTEIRTSWPDASTWPRKCVKKVDNRLIDNMISGIVNDDENKKIILNPVLDFNLKTG